MLPKSLTDTWETPGCVLIKEHYEHLGIWPMEGSRSAWGTDRALDLADSLHISPYELGVMVGVAIPQMHKYLRDGVFPIPVCIHFHILDVFKDLKLTPVPTTQTAYPIHLPCGDWPVEGDGERGTEA